ncbi:MAG: T9SS type A sorting domain-containing protein [Flavobacteriales bacterium]|nr:T9SS type A sorting domain-containing protein [Flavobacteriales bacterium]
MKRTLLSIVCITLGTASFAQQTTHNWNYDGVSRKYIQYVPSVYDGSEAVPLVLALHGLGDNVTNFQGVGFQSVADTANFIVVYPEALVDQAFTGSTAWNSGAGAFGISLNGTVDDVGFLNALMDTLSAQYNIDQTRIFATGFSMGGFMANRLACELNNRVAATASVSGPIGSTLTCNPGQPVRVCHFHGTADATVGYGTDGGGTNDNTFGTSVLEWISFWTTNNGCGNVTLEGQFPNTRNDGYTVDYVEYAGCNDDSRVVHYKVHGADHTWLFKPTNDIDYTTEIWKFFIGVSPSNLVPAGIAETEIATIGIYPNPTTGMLTIENTDSKLLNISVFSTTGQLVKNFSAVSRTVDVSDLEKGVYQMMVATETGLFSNSFVKQ